LIIWAKLRIAPPADHADVHKLKGGEYASGGLPLKKLLISVALLTRAFKVATAGPNGCRCDGAEK